MLHVKISLSRVRIPKILNHTSALALGKDWDYANSVRLWQMRVNDRIRRGRDVNQTIPEVCSSVRTFWLMGLKNQLLGLLWMNKIDCREWWRMKEKGDSCRRWGKVWNFWTYIHPTLVFPRVWNVLTSSRI